MDRNVSGKGFLGSTNQITLVKEEFDGFPSIYWIIAELQCTYFLSSIFGQNLAN
jgi:hypothetical protein